MGLAVPGAPPGSAVARRCGTTCCTAARAGATLAPTGGVGHGVYMYRSYTTRPDRSTTPRQSRTKGVRSRPLFVGLRLLCPEIVAAEIFPARGTRGEVLPAGNPHRTPTLSPVTLRPRANRTLPNAAHRACRHCNTTWHTTQRAPHASPSRTRATADHGSLASTPRMLPLRSMISSGLRLRT